MILICENVIKSFDDYEDPNVLVQPLRRFEKLAF